MFILKLTGCAAAAAFASFISINAAQAAMSPITHYGKTPPVHHVDCAVGFHIGPLGTCIMGADDVAPPPPGPPAVVIDGPAPAPIEGRAADEGCETRSVKRQNSFGDSETRTVTNCPQ
jgi:hypothetical protein